MKLSYAEYDYEGCYTIDTVNGSESLTVFRTLRIEYQSIYKKVISSKEKAANITYWDATADTVYEQFVEELPTYVILSIIKESLSVLHQPLNRVDIILGSNH